jgi:hypothetical protein
VFSTDTYSNDPIKTWINDVCQNLGINLDSKSINQTNTQTISHLKRYDFRMNSLLSLYTPLITQIESDFFKQLLKSILEKEIDFAKKSFRVFYHGQKREFMLLQDIYNGLYEIAYKKPIDNFFMLRIPNNDFKKFTCIKDFLKQFIRNNLVNQCGFDHLPDISKVLLSVNPSLFGNIYNPGECTFCYFIDSKNVDCTNTSDLITQVFNVFNYQHYLSTYNNDIKELNKLLEQSETTKTGILLQIFIPENLVNQLAYRCISCGRLYYQDNEPEKHSATYDLDIYNKEKTNGWFEWLGFRLGHPKSLGAMQFRLLINQTTLDPNSGIKMYRYYNKTPNIKLYEDKLKKLLANIKADVEGNLA